MGKKRAFIGKERVLSQTKKTSGKWQAKKSEYLKKKLAPCGQNYIFSNQHSLVSNDSIVLTELKILEVM